MKVIFYHSPLCPRCYLAKKNLYSILEQYKDITVQEVDVMRNLKLTKDNGIRLFPALQYEDKTISGVFLSKDKIDIFFKSIKVA